VERRNNDLGFALRPVSPRDLSEVATIEALSFPCPWKLEFFESELTSRSRYHRVLSRAESELPALGGYLFAVQLHDELHINKIATHPALRRRGLGRRLLEDALAHARGVEAACVVLEVRESNAAAIEFYNTYGFSRAQKRRAYYQDGEDALVLLLPLVDPALPPR
jgi:ribosomal-protein-alanine N-acetyltransferase